MEDLLLAILVILAIAAVRARDLLGSTAVLGAYSLVMAVLWCAMNALDVAFTEAAVGAGISTVLMLAALNRIGRREQGRGLVLKPSITSIADRLDELETSGRASSRAAILVCMAVAAVLVYGAQDMPIVGDPESPANANAEVAQRYLGASPDLYSEDGERVQKGEVGPANVVTSVLGDYRGYDTMGETVVIFTAALCVLLLLRQSRPRSTRRRKVAGKGGDDGANG